MLWKKNPHQNSSVSHHWDSVAFRSCSMLMKRSPTQLKPKLFHPHIVCDLRRCCECDGECWSCAVPSVMWQWDRERSRKGSHRYCHTISHRQGGYQICHHLATSHMIMKCRLNDFSDSSSSGWGNWDHENTQLVALSERWGWFWSAAFMSSCSTAWIYFAIVYVCNKCDCTQIWRVQKYLLLKCEEVRKQLNMTAAYIQSNINFWNPESRSWSSGCCVVGAVTASLQLLQTGCRAESHICFSCSSSLSSMF